MGKNDSTIAVLVLLAIGIILIKSGKIQILQPTGDGLYQPPGGGGVGGFGQLASLSVKASDSYTTSAKNVTAELWDSNGQVVSETVIGSALTSMSSSLPNSFTGYIMIGKDNFETSTAYRDGDDYYYKNVPVAWSNQQGLVSYSDIKSYAENVAGKGDIWTFYDDNAAENPAAITIGSGGTYSAAKIKLMSSSNNCTGSPEMNAYNGKKAIGYCFNETVSGRFKEISPLINSGSFSIPGFLSGKNVVSCYYTTDSLCDGNSFTTNLYFEANSGQNPAGSTTTANQTTITFVNNTAKTMTYPYLMTVSQVSNDTHTLPSSAAGGVGSAYWTATNASVTIITNATFPALILNVSYTYAEPIYIIPVDLCYYKDDSSKWAIGFGDESDLAADTDCGMNSISAAYPIYTY